MVRKLAKVGNSQAVILTRDMKEHLGITDAVDVRIEQGKIVLTAPKMPAAAAAAVAAPRKRQGFEEAMNSTFSQYDKTMRVLAETPDK